jgi:hypothetical protein
MQTLELIEAMNVLLLEERAAIVRLDGRRVEELAKRKLETAIALEQRPRDERNGRAVQLRALARLLRQNQVLLGQARAIVNDVLVGPRRLEAHRRGAPPTAAPRHFSIRA